MRGDEKRVLTADRRGKNVSPQRHGGHGEPLEIIVATQAMEKNKLKLAFFSHASAQTQGLAFGPMLRLDFKQENFV